MEWLSVVAEVARDIAALAALGALLITPIRKRLFADKEARDGQLCLLRSEIVRIYYRHLEERRMRQYEYENMSYCYKAYKAPGGNTFIEHIYAEMQEWTVTQ